MYSALEYTLTLPFALFKSKISFVDETGKNNLPMYDLLYLLIWEIMFPKIGTLQEIQFLLMLLTGSTLMLN